MPAYFSLQNILHVNAIISYVGKTSPFNSRQALKEILRQGYIQNKRKPF